MDSILITGVSTGIGNAAAKKFCMEGYHVFGSVRSQSDADRIRQEIPGNITPVVFDVTDERSVLSGVKKVEENLKGDLIGIVNNAGIALGGPLLLLETDILRKQFEVNVFGVLTVVKTFFPLLVEARRKEKDCKIINISSVSGKQAHPFVGPYTASKHALEALTDVMRKEFLKYGVDVIAIEPGPIVTPIWDKTPDPEKNEFLGSDYERSLRLFYKFMMKKGREGLPPEDVADLIWKVARRRKSKTRYVIMRNKFLNFHLPNLLPERLLDKLTGKALKII